MKKLELKSATRPLQEYASRPGFEPLVLTAKGKPVAALIHLKNADWETISLSMNPKFMHIIERSRARARKEGTIPLEEVRKNVGIPSQTRERRKRNPHAAKRISPERLK